MLIRTSVNLYPHNRAKAEKLAAQLGVSFGKFFNLVMENLSQSLRSQLEVRLYL